MKTDFQVLKFKFLTCNFKQAFYSLYKLVSRGLDNTTILLYKFFVRYLVVKPAYVNAALVKRDNIVLVSLTNI